MIRLLLCLGLACTVGACLGPATEQEESHTAASLLSIQEDSVAGTLAVFRQGGIKPLVTQHVRPDFRPYIHPIQAPDGKGELTEYSPGHHKHQTGLYWGFTRVNGRDFFHHPEGDYWKRISYAILEPTGTAVSWQTVYHLLDEGGEAVLEETQTWEMQESDGKFFLSLTWQGKGLQEVTIGEYDYGGLFLRMPWKEGITGRVLNAARQQNEQAEGKRAMWVDVAMQVSGREDLAHIAIFDHSGNADFPQPWRVDGQLGVGPVRARLGDWTIAQGETATIRHQLVAYTEELSDLEITELWEEYSGEKHMYSTASLWGIAQQEGRQAKFLNPQEAVAAMTLNEDFEVNAWAAEPMITQPMAFCWDDRGRLWVAENRDYESRGTGFSNSGDSRILILEDTDGDGQADRKKVFLEGIPFPSALAVGFNGLFLGAPPHLLFVPDEDGNDQADREDIEIRLTGWGIRDRHETINSFHWGPDGWLYGLEGFATPSNIRKPGPEETLYTHRDPFPEDLLSGEGVDINGGVWRYHPTQDRFEVVAHGFSNPWGIDYDAKGQLFITACVIPHAFHVIPGGIYHRQGGQHFNPYVYSDLQTIVDHGHRSAHGGARVYLSDAFPQQHRGRLFMANIHEHAVLSDVLTSKGSGFVASHGEDFLMANNAQWIGFSMELGPSGDLYVLDWHDADICGKEVLQKETGRIFRISPKNSQAENWEGRYQDLKQMSDAELVEMQGKISSWHARRARIVLQERAHKGSLSPSAVQRLKSMFEEQQNPDYRLRAMWALHVTQSSTEDELLEALEDEDAYIRAWAIQFLNEDLDASSKVLGRLAKLASRENSAVVRLYLAAALQRIPFNDRWEIAEALVLYQEDIADHNIPLMLWFGIEPLVEEDPARALNLAKASNIPLVSRYIARRLVDANEFDLLVEGLEGKPEVQKRLLEGMQDGLQGRNDLKTPKDWNRIATRWKESSTLGPLVMDISRQFGSVEAAQSSMSVLVNSAAPVQERKRALKGLANQQWEALAPQLPMLFKDTEMRLEALRAVAAFDQEELGETVMALLSSLSGEEKTAALQSMASRSRYGRMLTQALEEGTLEKREVPVYIARQLRRVVGNGFVEVWGPIDPLASDKAQQYEVYRTLLRPEVLVTANLEKGHTLFRNSCGACHQLFGEGGKLGPDITGANRGNLDYLLSNILEPSGEIQDDYKMMVLTTQDGRTYSGNLAAETPRQLILRTVGQDSVIVNISEIQSRQTLEVSMMPEGLLSTLSKQEVIDLIAYLQSAQPLAISN